MAGECGHTLEEVDLALCKNLSDAALVDIAVCCHKLTLLRIDGLNLITDVSFKLVGRSCPLLETLSASGCFRITPAALSSFAHECERLSVLRVGQIESFGNFFPPMDLPDKELANIIHHTGVLRQNVET